METKTTEKAKIEVSVTKEEKRQLKAKLAQRGQTIQGWLYPYIKRFLKQK